MKNLIFFFCFFLSGLFSLGQESFENIIEDCESKFSGESNISLRQKRTLNCLIGKKFPDFHAETLNGSEVNLEDFSGSALVINLWFRNCPPCMAEIPGLNKLYDKYSKKGVQFLSFTTDSPGVVEYMLENEQPFKFDIVPNAKEVIYHDLNLTYGFPTTIILDNKGYIKYISTGGGSGENTSEIIFNTLSTQLQMCL